MKKSHEKREWQLEDSYRSLPATFYSLQQANPVPEPELVIFNYELAKERGIDETIASTDSGRDWLVGNQIPSRSEGIAQAYAGHQFGQFTMLGDGRALLLGEHVTPNEERYDIQLKGSGRTSFSRGGDGRAALGPMLREYLISEGMNGLGIPTTRSLAVVKTGQAVQREKRLPGAVLTRMAKSHIRVGTFQYAAARGDVSDLKALADYTINRHEHTVSDGKNPYLAFLHQVIEKQAELIANWQLVGFVHGVMNTDNMAISGETIDYGPCAFLDQYDPMKTFSSIDRQGRYSYGNQPYMANWNLARLAEALLPLLASTKETAVQLAQQAIETFTPLYTSYWLKGMRKKVGFIDDEQEEDRSLIERLLKIMSDHNLDYTLTFRQLSTEGTLPASIENMEHCQTWKKEWENRVNQQSRKKSEIENQMLSVNPFIIPRNEHVEQVLEDVEKNDDHTLLHAFLVAIRDPFKETEMTKRFAQVSASKTPYITYCGT
ncbi:YdiU family protein [Bacillus sp. C1-1]|nr:YdiU family protein [Bacillus sp. C1-1]